MISLRSERNAEEIAARGVEVAIGAHPHFALRKVENHIETLQKFVADQSVITFVGQSSRSVARVVCTNVAYAQSAQLNARQLDEIVGARAANATHRIDHLLNVRIVLQSHLHYTATIYGDRSRRTHIDQKQPFARGRCVESDLHGNENACLAVVEPLTVDTGVAAVGLLVAQNAHILVGIVELDLAPTHELHSEHSAHVVAEDLAQVEHHRRLVLMGKFAHSILPTTHIDARHLSSIACAAYKCFAQSALRGKMLGIEGRIEQQRGVARVENQQRGDRVADHDVKV